MEKAKIINSGSFTPDNSYFAWLNDVKAKLHRSQIKASLRINQAMLEFYWEMGHDIETLQKSHSWGGGFFERLSLDLRSEFPGREGFSVTNLRYMKNWYLFYNQCFKKRLTQKVSRMGQRLEMMIGRSHSRNDVSLISCSPLVIWNFEFIFKESYSRLVISSSPSA